MMVKLMEITIKEKIFLLNSFLNLYKIKIETKKIKLITYSLMILKGVIPGPTIKQVGNIPLNIV